MPIELTRETLRGIFPKAPSGVIDAFLAKQDVLTKHGVNHTRQRLAWAFANVEHECAGYTILRENINYSHERLAAVFPNRFSSAADVIRKYGNEKGWQLKAFDDIYGGRMGNRKGTNDGSTYIGRGGPQITGRDCYKVVGDACGVDLISNPVWAETHDLQPEILCGFVDWKRLNLKADAGDWKGYVKTWNGGHNGMADREAKLKGNDPFFQRMVAVELAKVDVERMKGAPPTKEPPQESIDEATRKERAARKGAVAGTLASGGEEVGKATGAGSTGLPTWAAISIGLVCIIAVVALGIMIAKKKSIVKANWR